MTLERLWPTARRLGALSLLVVGGVHLQEYSDGYAEIETIGWLFMLNFVAATVMAVGLLLPVERVMPRWGATLVALLALGGVGLSATSLVMLWIAERRPLFGFMEPGFHPEMIQLSRISEVATVLLLGAFLVARLFGGSAGRGADTDEKPTNANPEETNNVSSQNRTLMRLAASGALTVAALVLAACGGDDGESTAVTDSGSTVSTAEVDGRTVLVNSDGGALYVSDEEQASGDVLCVSDGCVAFWEPLTIDGGTPTGDVTGELGVVARPDGTDQVTLDGDPLYTFTDDSSGQINGDGLSDTFDGQTLTWRVVESDAGGTDTGGADGQDGGFDY